MTGISKAGLSLRRKRVKQALDRLSRDPDFKTVLEWLMQESGVTRPKYSKDPTEIVWNESKRHLVMSILNLMARDSSDAFIEELEKEITN